MIEGTTLLRVLVHFDYLDGLPYCPSGWWVEWGCFGRRGCAYACARQFEGRRAARVVPLVIRYDEEDSYFGRFYGINPAPPSKPKQESFSL